MRTPVNEPGPTTAPNTSISAAVMSLICSAVSTIGMTRWLCVCLCVNSAS